ncbi:MAG: hypothetical protein ACKOC5_13070 [Chloroflexota bacterium]
MSKKIKRLPARARTSGEKAGQPKPEKKKKPQQPEQISLHAPWISMRTGVIVVAIASLAMAVLTAVQVVPSQGMLKGILWGLFFGAMIWAIFFGNLLVNRFLRRRS